MKFGHFRRVFSTEPAPALPLLALLHSPPGFRLSARWNRLSETVKTRKKREKTGGKWARYGLKRVKEPRDHLGVRALQITREPKTTSCTVRPGATCLPSCMHAALTAFFVGGRNVAWARFTPGPAAELRPRLQPRCLGVRRELLRACVWRPRPEHPQRAPEGGAAILVHGLSVGSLSNRVSDAND